MKTTLTEMYGSGDSLILPDGNDWCLWELLTTAAAAVGDDSCPVEEGAMTLVSSAVVSGSLILPEPARLLLPPFLTLGAGLSGNNSGLIWPLANASRAESSGDGDEEREPDASEDRSVIAPPFMVGE